jgi:prevent-host-death family protein
MKVTITHLRRDLFRLVDRAKAGDPVEFTYKGVVFRIVPENRRSKLDNIKPERVLAEDVDLPKQSEALLREMQKEWEEDWAEL